MLKNQRGMSLIEIMIVLAIIGVVLGMLAQRIGNNVEKSKVKETKIQMTTLISSLDMYNSECGKFPAALESLIQADESCKNWAGPYIQAKKVPQDAWNHDFFYESDGNTYIITSYGKDGKEGGTDSGKDITQDDLGN